MYIFCCAPNFSFEKIVFLCQDTHIYIKRYIHYHNRYILRKYVYKILYGWKRYLGIWFKVLTGNISMCVHVRMCVTCIEIYTF